MRIPRGICSGQQERLPELIRTPRSVLSGCLYISLYALVDDGLAVICTYVKELLWLAWLYRRPQWLFRY